MNKQKSIFRRTLSVLLAALFVFSCGSIAFAQTSTNSYPIIYIYGRSALYKNVASDTPELIPYSVDETMENVIRADVPYAARAMLFGEWDKYNDKTYELLMDAFDGFALNADGEVDNGSGVLFKWSESSLPKSGGNSVTAYPFCYDARLSPLEIADDLNEYIEAVKRVTGKNKVSVVARCLGTNILFAYLYKYQEKQNYSGIDSIVLYDHSLYGVEILDAAMGGVIKADSYALGKFLNYYSESGDVSSTLASAMRLLQTSYGVSMSASVVDNFYSHVRNESVLHFLKDTYATCPGFWSMVYDHYSQAMNYLFSETGDLQKYSRLIAKVKAYRENVQLRIPTMINAMKNKGVNVAVVCKYGFQGYPLYENAYALSDKLTSLEKQSFGATCTKVDATFSAAFIRDCKENQMTGRFISPDKQVYAFTCLLPYNTWYIKNLDHPSFYGCVNALLVKICRNHININDIKDYPQFMMLTEEDGAYRIVPMTENNSDPTGVISGNGSGNSGNNDNGGSSSSGSGILQTLLGIVQFFASVFATLIGFLTGSR